MLRVVLRTCVCGREEKQLLLQWPTFLSVLFFLPPSLHTPSFPVVELAFFVCGLEEGEGGF